MNIIEMEPAPPPVRTKQPQGLLLHCGGRAVGREELLAVPTPRGTETWYPLNHGAILEEVEGQLSATGFSIGGERHALSHGGLRYFAVLAVSLPGQSKVALTRKKRSYDVLPYVPGCVATQSAKLVLLSR